MSKSLGLQQQVYALKQAVHEQEAELRATMESRETEKREREINNHKNTARAHKQVRLNFMVAIVGIIYITSTGVLCTCI